MEAPLPNQKALKKEIKKHFKKKDRRYFQKTKRPKADCYPIIHNDPYLVLENPRGYESLFLVGRNWANNPEKKIALVYGCNNWKLGFLSEYLADYRTAFVPRKRKSSLSCWSALKNLSEKPSIIYVWSYTENYAIRSYAKKHNIPISRIEDGFLRSSSLGASHSTPLSLVIDNQDLFFNSEKETRLENLLNSYDFKVNPELLDKAQTCLNTLLDLQLSKYNNPEFIETKTKLNLKFKRKVGVIGQVDSDAAIKLGNPDKWSFEDLVRLASYENPDAEIIYRPHPEVYRGYQKNRLKRNEISQIATIAPPEGPLWDFLDELDHVYTISSLSGFEAVIRGIKVTTVGVAFYGGWGLTDDRVKIPRRTAKLSLLEAFAAIYLLYPTYLSNPDDSYLGFLTACYAIKADQEIELNRELENQEEPALYKSNMLWAKQLFDSSHKTSVKHQLALLKSVNFSEIFHKDGEDPIFQIAFPLLMLSTFETNELKFDFVLKIKKVLTPAAFSKLIDCAQDLLPQSFISSLHASYLSQDIHSKSAALAALDDIATPAGESKFHTNKASKLLLTDIDTYINLGLNKEALEFCLQIIPSCKDYTALLQALIKVSDLLLDFESTLRFSKLLQSIDLHHANRLGTAAEIKASLLTSERSRTEKMLLLAKTIKLKPELVGLCEAYIKQFPDTFDEDLDPKILHSLLYVDNDITYRKALGYIASENAPKACEILETLISAGDKSPKLAVTYSQALSYSDRLPEAEELISQALEIYFVPLVIHEYLRVCILRSNYSKALSVIEKAELNGVEVGDMHRRKVFFGNRKLREAFETFTQIRAAKALHKYFPEKYIFDSSQIYRLRNAILLSLYGPGDEIRFASIYHNLTKRFKNQQLTISATPRLQSLFERSFPEIQFIPVERPRKTDRIDTKAYNQVPGSDIIDVIDNDAASIINEYDGVALVTDFLHQELQGYESFSRESYLVACPDKTAELRARLPQGKRLVGISWRSSLTTHSRNEHYLTIEQILPLFAIDDIVFVNLQYDECDEELEYVEQHHPGKLINLADIDQYNDFDSVAALMSCLDLIISPATTVVELAGALGVDTWLFANSSEIHWRRIENTNNDVWHGNCEIVEGEQLGSHASLVEALESKLTQYAKTSCS